MISLNKHLKNLWSAYPIYHAQQDERGGIPFFRMIPITDNPGNKALETSDDAIQPNHIYIMVGKKKLSPASLFPMAIFYDGDILFFNGAESYDKCRYLGYVNHHFGKDNTLTTPHNETTLCKYFAFFLGLPTLATVDFSNAVLLARVMDLGDSEWRFPKLKPDMKVGAEERPYRLIKPIGEGSMAAVWKAESLIENQIVALKFLKDINNSVRFRREARAIEKVSKITQRVVEYHDFQFDPDPRKRVSFLAMEHLTGGSLQQIAGKDDPIDYKNICKWMADVLDALKALEDSGIVHRDIKPSNLLFDSTGRVKLCDLGLVGAEDEKNQK